MASGDGMSALPKEAQDYVRLIEKYTKLPIELVSFGPDRAETMDLRIIEF